MVSTHKNSRFIVSCVFFCLVLWAKEGKAASKTIDVVFLTQSGSQVLKSWTTEEIQKVSAGNHSNVSAQKLIFDESAGSLVLNDRASIDLVTITTDTKTIRVPRFLIWRGFFRFRFDPKTGELSSSVKNLDRGRLLIPSSYFDATNIRKIELSDHLTTYPQTKLRLRTNPAASRGEKLFTQSCLACHSVSTYGSPALNPAELTATKLHNFDSIHKGWSELKIDSKSSRGLVEYSEALALQNIEKNTEKKSETKK